MTFKAVLFDLDGTLLDTIDDIADSMNHVLKTYGFPEHDRESYKLFVGDGMGNLVRRALPPDKLDESLIAECLAAMRREYQTRWAKKTKVYPEILELLTLLSSKNIKMAVYSNKPDDFTKLMAAQFFSYCSFEQVIGSRPGKPLKPDPAVALEIAANMMVSAFQIVYLGDTGTDMKTAVAAGMYPVGALWGFRTREELTANGAKVLIKHPLELQNLIFLKLKMINVGD
jgi:phosphoglycolate phosphatase